MTIKTLSISLLFTGLAIASCTPLFFSQKKEEESAPEKVVEARFPTTHIPLPVVNFDFLQFKPELAQAQLNWKKITTNFSTREKSQIAIPDAKLFAKGNKEIIDLFADEYAYPLPGAKVISPYGGRRGGHSGVDIKTCANDTILAAFSGIVRMALPYAAYGNIVVIRHYNGLETLYSHNSKNLVALGDHVQAGDPIALTGRTGRATTEHLHFETRINGQHFNPNIVFNLSKQKLYRKRLVCTQKGGSIIVKAVDILPHQKKG